MKYYCIKQYDETDCGAACLATISAQYGFKIPVTRIREVAGTDTQGTNIRGLIIAAEQLGLDAKGVKGKQEAIFDEYPLPCIAHMLVNGDLFHYVVIHKVTKKQIIIADPNKGIVKLTPEEFFGETKEENGVPEYKWTGILILFQPTVDFQKGDVRKGLFQRFIKIILPQKQLMLNILMASLLYTGLGIIGAFFYKALMDYVIPNSITTTLMVLSIGVIFLTTFQVLLNAFRSQLLLHLSQKFDISLLFSYYRHVLNLPMSFFGSRKIGEIISRINDSSQIREAISNTALTLIADSLMAIIGGIILFKQNSSMFMITILILGLCAFILLIFRKPYKEMNYEQMEDVSQFTSYLVETLGGMLTIKSYNVERKVTMKAEGLFVRSLKSMFNLSTLSNLQVSLKDFVDKVGRIVILWVGALSVIDGNMTMGQLITFYSLLQYFLDPLKNVMDLQPKIQSALVAADRLGEILDLNTEISHNEYQKIAPEKLEGNLIFKNVDFRYGTRRLVLEDINFCIKKGQHIAFVGESGSGKTTIANLILRLYDVEQGEITIDDINVKDISLERLRGRIAYVPQETFLFSGTIYENLTLGLEDPNYKTIIQAAKKSKAHDFINNLPLRYETRLEENGSNLSGGQRQRLAITRALAKEPDILILDEATSNLDSITEKAISETICGLGENITTITIAHRLSTIKYSDCIFVLDKGKIKEYGTHQELIDKGGVYYNLVKQQSLEGD